MKLRFAISLSMAAVLAVAASMVSGAMLAGAQGQVPATGNVVVQDGSQPGEVIISWDAVPEATHYRIGYVNMVTDYPLAKASRTGNWLEAFVYVDVEAQNFTVAGGRTEYTVRRLAQGARHAFTVRTGDDIDGAFTWPSNPRWEFHVVADRGGAAPAPSTSEEAAVPGRPTASAECYVGQQLTPGQSCWFQLAADDDVSIFAVTSGGPYHGWGQVWLDDWFRFFRKPVSQSITVDGVRHRFEMEKQGSDWVIVQYGPDS